MVVPGANGVTTVMAPDGYRSCARTGTPSIRVAATTAAPTGVSFMASPPYRMPDMAAVLFDRSDPDQASNTARTGDASAPTSFSGSAMSVTRCPAARSRLSRYGRVTIPASLKVRDALKTRGASGSSTP